MSLRSRYTELDEAIEDYTQWYVSNMNRMSEGTSSSLENEVRFLRTALDGTLFIMHLLRDQVRLAQQQTLTDSALWLPTSLAIR